MLIVVVIDLGYLRCLVCMVFVALLVWLMIVAYVGLVLLFELRGGVVAYGLMLF